MSSSLTEPLGSSEAPLVTIVRVAGSDHDVAGVLNVRGRTIAVTLELAWRDNARAVSCIPHGRYLCKRVQSPKHGDTFEVTGVPGRSAILFHAGNVATDSQGCVLLGAAMGPTRDNGMRTVLGSRIARDRFRQELAGVPAFWLEVTTLPDVPAVVGALTGRAR
jgi:hypothetical protein